MVCSPTLLLQLLAVIIGVLCLPTEIKEYTLVNIQMETKKFEPTAPKTNKKVPEAIFIENVEEVCEKNGFDTVKNAVDEAYNKYKLIQSQLMKSNENMILKIPEIQKALDIIRTLKKQKEISIDYLLTEAVWAKGKATDTSKIAIWLGANTMVEFNLEQAQKLLTTNLENAKSNLQQIKEDLNFVKDQVTTSEVNIARIYNHSVALKNKEKN